MHSDIPSLHSCGYNIGLKFLRVLRFRYVDATGEVLECLLPNCPVLERLTVHFATKNLVGLRVVGPSVALKYLDMRSCWVLKSIEICDANLVPLVYVGGAINLLLNNVPLLAEVSISERLHAPSRDGQFYYRSIELPFAQLSYCLSQLEVLSMDINGAMYNKNYVFPVFANLKHLELIVQADYRWARSLDFLHGGSSLLAKTCVEGVPNVILLVRLWRCRLCKRKGPPIMVSPKTKLEPDGISPADLVATLGGLEVDFVLLAGYLKLIPVELIQAYPRSILNIHPSLLPSFGSKGHYGMNVRKAVIASGARYTSPTIHFVDEHYDTERILSQRVVPVLAKDAAEEQAARVLREEHSLYVEVITTLCEERIVWREDGFPIIQSKENPNEYS